VCQPDRAQKALSLLDRLTVRERLWIRAVVEDWRGNRERGIENYKTYLAQYPDDSSGWFRLGYTYLITDRPKQSIEAFEKVIEIDPEASVAYVNIASCYNFMNMDQEALANYDKSFQMDEDLRTSTFVNHEYGFLLVRMGEFEKADQNFRIMLAQETADMRASGNRSLGMLNTYLGKYSEALEHFGEALLIHRTAGGKLSEMRDHMYLAAAHRAKGERSAVIREMGAARKIQREIKPSPSWLTLAGKFYARMGMIREAKEIYAEISNRIGDLLAPSGVKRSNRGDQAAYYLLKGEIELAERKFDEAIETFESALTLESNNYYLESLAFAHYSRGNLDEAIAKYEQLLETRLLTSEAQEHWILAHYRLGILNEQKGDIDKATEFYEQFLDIWKEADTDLVSLVDARKHLSRLKSRNG